MKPDALKHAVEQIEMNEAMQARVLRRSLDYGKEHNTMQQKRNYKRIAVIAVAAVMALSVTAFAAVRSQARVLWMDGNSTIENMAEAQQALKDTGSNVTLPEQLADGYTFAGANVTHQMLAEESGQDAQEVSEGEDGTVFTFVDGSEERGVSCVYRKGDEEVALDASKLDDLLYDEETAECDVVELEGQTFYYSEGDTVTATTMTAEDGVVEDSSMESRGGTFRSVSWQKDGISYSLSQLDGSLTREELVQTALELCK